MLAAVTLIAEGISYFSAETVDTKEGLAIIKAAEKENVKDIEKKINKLDTKDKLESQEASGEINYKSLFSSSVVMGDSISEAFTEYDLLNASSVVAKIGVELDELDDQIKTVADINPQVIFLSYGMNDVIATNGDTDLFIKEYKAVIDQLRKKLPDTTLYVNSIFPVSAAKQEEKPVFQKIPEYNAALQKMCDENQIAFLDNTSLVSDTYYEEDGIHFKADLSNLAQTYGGGSNFMTDKIKNLKKTVVIKYALVAVIVVYVALLLIFTSGSTKSFAAVEKKVEASLDTKAMKKAGVQG